MQKNQQQDQSQIKWISDFIWNIADDRLRNVYVRPCHELGTVAEAGVRDRDRDRRRAGPRGERELSEQRAVRLAVTLRTHGPGMTGRRWVESALHKCQFMQRFTEPPLVRAGAMCARGA